MTEPHGDAAARQQPTGQAGLLPTADGPAIRGALGALLRSARWLAAGAFLLMLVATGLGLLIPPLLGYLVDLVAEQRAADTIVLPVLLILGIAIGQGITTAVGLTRLARLGEGMLAELRERFVRRALHLPLERVEQAGSGDLTARVTNDVSMIADAVRNALPELARSGLTIVLTLIGMIVLDWRFAAVALVVAPIHVLTVRWYQRHAVPLYAAQRVATGAQQHQLLDTVGGAHTVRTFRLGTAHVDKVRTRSTRAMELMLRGVRLVTGFYNRLNFAELLGLSTVLITGFVLVQNGSATIGTATAAALYFHNLFNPINAALRLVDDAQVALASLARLVGVTELPPQPENTRTGQQLDPTIKVANVRHEYVPGQPVLRDIDLEVAAGQRVALVGASGAGKTTLAKLIAGIHAPSRGSITLGEVDLTERGPHAISDLVGLISQEVHVFAGPLADDLRLAKPKAADEELLAAVDQVGARDWVQALPDGLATVVGEGGHRLTVTQAQQLALARLILADPRIAILDEATADAGSAGARVLESAAANALAGRTALVVAHRLTQAAACDRIVVLDAGAIVETGTHDELVAADGRYARLWRAWSAPRPT
ncbi:ATP-binding cassette subfamily C protein [Tamaricihabitans halophyticus]|uniref:ATP-binding cassette subfamily C protein n=1 Tax=Tamaricihabitans halophyticus TaxID=1262583 RepID=A0A4R2QWV7_9PSEU|nr:ABC transporter ATP-binding protein [Tamaricihabitans halophyticus]TCP53629.1 ATP-binding cassette subfamily C protein [Tamaricihabitans halophyticus]